ncbi:MAG: hypothetical protein OHK0029_05600 [Armatimonadaceae bacterium]
MFFTLALLPRPVRTGRDSEAKVHAARFGFLLVSSYHVKAYPKVW